MVVFGPRKPLILVGCISGTLLAFDRIDAFSAPALTCHPGRSHSSRATAKRNTLLWSNAAAESLEVREPTPVATSPSRRQQRFNGTASTDTQIADECIITIHGVRHDVQAFARAHPAVSEILRKFHQRDATRAFEAAGHSDKAYEMLKDFAIEDDSIVGGMASADALTISVASSTGERDQNKRIKKTLWKRKLFTMEDPIGVHKYLGIFCLLHFAYRYGQIFFGDTSAGFGSRGGLGASATAGLWLIPHGMLNLSSFIFHVPRERIVGKPIIWKEYRVHNLIFVLRSAICTALCWISVYHEHTPIWRRAALVGSGMSILGANWAADEATKRLQPAENDSSVASLPFWEGCTLTTQRRIKKFYAYCQFMATISCLTITNPIWPFIVLMPIQMSSILLTLVRKSIISARGFHIGYFASLLFPFFVASKHIVEMGFAIDVPLAFALGTGAFLLRCKGVRKYMIWGPLVALRITLGDRIMNYAMW